jgi:hypothetical protein
MERLSARCNVDSTVLRHKLLASNGDALCSLWDGNWIFKYCFEDIKAWKVYPAHQTLWWACSALMGMLWETKWRGVLVWSPSWANYAHSVSSMQIRKPAFVLRWFPKPGVTRFCTVTVRWASASNNTAVQEDRSVSECVRSVFILLICWRFCVWNGSIIRRRCCTYTSRTMK